MYSQNNEQKYITEYFKGHPSGKYIDIGAFHVTMFSNTRRLFELGWQGVLVEPSPINYKAIADHYADESRVTVLNYAVGDTSGEIDFYESNGDAVSTSDEAHMIKWGNAGAKYSKIKVQQVSVVDFMNEHCKDVSFISIDTESTNLDVFRSIPDFVWEQIKMIVIEHDGKHEEISDKLSSYGFVTLHINAENIILAKV